MDSYKASAFSIVCLIIIFVLIWIAFVRWHDLKGSILVDRESLQQTTGIINSSKVECYSGRNGKLYRFAITYIYTVDGENFASDSVSFSQGLAMDEQTAQQFVEKYPVGKVVQVFYKNDEHSFSVIEPENKDFSLIAVVVGIFVTLTFSVISLIHFFKRNMYFG